VPAAVLRSACPLDCPDACSLEVAVEDGRVVRVGGSTDRNALTGGFICSKVQRIAAHVHGDARVRFPHRRTGAKGSRSFERISWDAALDLVAAKLVEVRDRFGGEAILPHAYGGSNGLLTDGAADALLFRRLGAARLARTICAIPTGRAALGLTGKMPGVALPDYEQARLIVVWGANPHASGIHFVPVVERARERGARLVVVDPRRTGLAGKADLHLAVRPGTDVAVALGAIHELFASGRADLAFLAAHATGWEELRRRAEPWTIERAARVAGIAAGDLRRFVDLYADSSPAVVRCGWGLERNRNGCSSVAAVLALPAVAGKFGVRGGGYTLSNSAAWSFDASGFTGPEPPTRIVNMNRIGAALCAEAEPRVRLLFVYNSNLLATAPQQNLVRRGLLRDDLFTVVADAVWTDTARSADVVFPATTFLEHDELARGYGAYVLHAIEPAIPPVGESRPNHDLFAELAVRTGVAERAEIPTAHALREALLDSTGRGAELRRMLAERGVALPAAGERPVQFVDVFPKTPDRKVRLVPEELDREAPGGLYAFRENPHASDRFPLTLISPATHRTISSTFGQLRRGRVPLEIHPDDAAPRGVATGARVRVWNELGEVEVEARVTRNVRPGVVELPKGLWSHNTLNGATANALAPDSLTDVGGGACFNDAQVEVDAIREDAALRAARGVEG
jgi:anaerobic selenocysteine-containing dehydrogenase